MVLVKLTIRNSNILNLDKVIEALQSIKKRGTERTHEVSLILKPIFLGRWAGIAGAWSISGFTLEDAENNPGLQNYSIFVDQDGNLTHGTKFVVDDLKGNTG